MFTTTTVDTIMNSFQATIKKLEAHSNTSSVKAAVARDTAEAHLITAKAHELEATRAANVATKLNEFMN